ncbi:sensor histidine kinase [Streptomyces gobiensis]|uniref:sensor histidine kinase n=1 Tax=Streptomyces gobiensis TaxID=2875706 RepID=UPI001E30FC6F|nr:sensor histidine kinase [Streptomyces gobiensis]UGY93880.1 sensor histidine kinase [Streptomyces gobiensis]
MPLRCRRRYAAPVWRGRWSRRWVRRVPPWAYDSAIALAITLISLLLGFEGPPDGWGWSGLDERGVLLTCLINLPLAARRRAPVALALGVLALWTAYISLGYWPVVNSPGALLALYTVASLRPLRHAIGCALLFTAVWNYAGTTGEESSWPTVLAQSLVYTAVVCGFGQLARNSAQRAVRLAELAEQLRRERAAGERRAVAEERVRIARELHDVVAHHMAVISVQAGLAHYVFGSDPHTARTALGTISDSSGEALSELRRLLAVLRVDGTGDRDRPDDPLDTAPGIGRLDELLERVRNAGVTVGRTVHGDPRPLPPGVDQCAFRVVQEALTNVIKHARPAIAQVTVDYQPRRLTITVTDEGQRTDPVRGDAGPGHGLIGMRERARIYGGTVTIGPRPSGGYEVRLTLPA